MLVETHDLTKCYRSLRLGFALRERAGVGFGYRRFTALSKCTFGVPRGEIFGLLGPNGAGKTTLLRLLLGFLRPTAGTASIDGSDCYRQSVATHRLLAYLPGDPRLFDRMNGREVLRFFGTVRREGDFQRAMKVAQRIELDVTRRVSSMSTGMRQKLALATVFSTDVPLLILDEPTSNLDPTMRSEVARLVLEAQKAGRTVLFSSHVMSEVEELCDRVVILRRGELVHTQIMSELRQQHRIRAKLAGPLPEPPDNLVDQVKIMPGANGEVTIIAPGELSSLMGWLATLPLKKVRIEPMGLRAIYDQFHDTNLT